MLEFFKKILTSDFLPHGTCYLWNPAVLWLNVISDLIISAGLLRHSNPAFGLRPQTPGFHS